MRRDDSSSVITVAALNSEHLAPTANLCFTTRILLINCVNPILYGAAVNVSVIWSIEHKSGMKMKIPNSGSGNGYYGHESGVIAYLDNDEPEVDIQPVSDSDFSEYMWMENEEEFDKEVLEQLEEEELMEECLEAMLEEERQHQRNQTSTAWCNATNSIDNSGIELCQQLGSLRVHGDLAKQSTLNPDAAEFVPSFKTTITPVSTTPGITSESS